MVTCSSSWLVREERAPRTLKIRQDVEEIGEVQVVTCKMLRWLPTWVNHSMDADNATTH